MVIVHLSDKQRRIISPGKCETLETLFKRFCLEFGYQESDYDFQSYPRDDLVSLDMNINANRVKEVSLVPKSSSSKASMDFCYTVTHNSSAATVPQKKQTPTIIPISINTQPLGKPMKRNAPKPPVGVTFNPIDELTSPDIDIPPPPAYLPDKVQNESHLFRSVQCETEHAESLHSRSSSDSMRHTIIDVGGILNAFNSKENIDHSDDEDFIKINSTDVNTLDIYHYNIPHASQESLNGLETKKIDDPRYSSKCSSVDDVCESELLKEVNLPLDRTDQQRCDWDPSPLSDPDLKYLEPAPVTVELDSNIELSDQPQSFSLDLDLLPDNKSESEFQEESSSLPDPNRIDKTTNLTMDKENTTDIDCNANAKESRFGSTNKKLLVRAKTVESSINVDFLSSSSEECLDESIKIPKLTNDLPLSDSDNNIHSIQTSTSSRVLQSWELPKQGKTMQFLSRAMHTLDIPDGNQDDTEDKKESVLESKAAPPEVSKTVQMIVQEIPEEHSDRPTYRPRQAKRLYFTASGK